jgi:cell wall-associated NlpC family hydrolase
MKRRLAAIPLLLLVFAACSPYPRYRPYAPVTPVGEESEVSAMTTNAFLRFGGILQKYLGRPYAGRSEYVSGMDCSAFTQKVFREFNKTLLPRKAAEQALVGREVPRRLMFFGDLVYFETERGKVSHVGIYIGYNDFVHASSTRGVIISSLKEPYWSQRWRGVRRILE